MTEFQVNDIVKIVRRNKGLDYLFPNSVRNRAFHIGEIGKVIDIPNPYPHETRIKFNVIMKIRVYKSCVIKIYNCIGEEIIHANKVERKRFTELEQKYIAEKVAMEL